jgi:hypothetical protein
MKLKDMIRILQALDKQPISEESKWRLAHDWCYEAWNPSAIVSYETPTGAVTYTDPVVGDGRSKQ